MKLFQIQHHSNNLTSHQIDLAAFPQHHNVRVLLKHALQIHKNNRCKDSLNKAHTHTFYYH